jgi:hypothetical protein
MRQQNLCAMHSALKAVKHTKYKMVKTLTDSCSPWKDLSYEPLRASSEQIVQ